jgi:hypothetical protein
MVVLGYFPVEQLSFSAQQFLLLYNGRGGCQESNRTFLSLTFSALFADQNIA